MSFDAAAQAQLAALLDRHAADENTMRLDEAQAFFTAMLSGPDAVDVVTWLPEVLGKPELYTPAEQAQMTELLQRMVKDISIQLGAKLSPQLILYPDESGAQDYLTWANAYLYALDVVETDWFEAVTDEGFEDLFYPVMALAGLYDEDENGAPILDISPSERESLQAELPASLLDIYLYWQAVLHKPTTIRREGDKVGRNEPCPCGSGKKYKACCGRSNA